jgi:acyl-ACP thioesterase
MELIWRESWTVGGFDTGPGATVTPAGLCRILQEAAGHHAEHLGCGVESLLAEGRAWALGKFAVKIESLPKLGHVVETTTWPCRRTAGIRAWRDFEMRDEAGRLVACATSMWFILDLEARRPVRLPAGLLAMELPEHLADVEPAASVTPAGEASHEWLTQVVWSDLDENRHANNVRYLEWSLDTLPAEIHERRALREIHIEFAAEALLGDAIRARSWGSAPGRIVHRVEAGGRELARLVTIWS